MVPLDWLASFTTASRTPLPARRWPRLAMLVYLLWSIRLYGCVSIVAQLLGGDCESEQKNVGFQFEIALAQLGCFIEVGRLYIFQNIGKKEIPPPACVRPQSLGAKPCLGLYHEPIEVVSSL